VHSVNGASLLVGGPGTCKTTCVNQFLGKFNSEVRAVGAHAACRRGVDACTRPVGAASETTSSVPVTLCVCVCAGHGQQDHHVQQPDHAADLPDGD
jgi:hypothetical protein